MHVKFTPDIEGIIRYMTRSIVTKTNIMIANAQKIFICIGVLLILPLKFWPPIGQKNNNFYL